MLVYGFLLFVTLTCLLLLMQALWGREIYNHYRGSRAVTCPETHRQVAVSFDALHAALTGLRGKCDLRLAECTRWPARIRCAQACIPEARQTALYTQGEVALPRAKPIYHVPVLIAAFAAFVFGALWHSAYLFRVHWREAFGLTRPELHQMVWWWSPHLLSLATCLLFAYGVAWLFACRRRSGIWQAIITAISLWAAVAVASLVFMGWTGIPGTILLIEISYTLLASIVIGAIIGGLSGKLIAPAP